jgi:hypothetical protein
MSEAKERFVEHLKRTRLPGATVRTKLTMRSSLMGISKNVTSVSRLDLTERPDRLPLIRSRLLSRVDDNDEARFVLDQTIDLETRPGGGGGDPTEASCFVWVPDLAKSKQIPIEPFMSFPQTNIRLMDYLLPVPELTSGWGLRLEGDRHVIAIDVLEPLPPFLANVLSPGLQQVRIFVNAAADAKLHRVEAAFADGGFRSVEVGRWQDFEGATWSAQIKVTGNTGEWTSTELDRIETANYTDLDRARLDRNSL